MESNSDKLSEDNGHYSVDEMIARLKDNERQKRSDDPDNEGELITRPDGSQVIKVRKHKRRSKQRSKKTTSSPRTNPKTKWAILGSIIAAFLILIAGTVFILAKYNGMAFKEKTQASISELVGAEATELTELRVTPMSAMASKAQFTWKNDSFYHSANFSDIRADIKATSFLSSDWIGEEVVAQRGNIELQTAQKKADSSDSPAISNYRFGTLRCNKLNVQFGSENNAPSITGLHASLRQGLGEGNQVIFNNGLLKIPNWPSLEISSGILTLNSTNTKIEARLASGENLKGEILIQGNVSNDTGRPLVLDVHSKNYPIQDLLGKELGRLIQGNVNSDMGSLSYDYKKKKVEALSFVMPFNSNELFISGLPMLTDLRELTGESQYTRPLLTHCSGTIMRTLAGVTLDHLNLIGNRIITLQGHISVSQEGQLSGELKVGIPARFFGKNGPAPEIFSEPHDGYIHTKVTLGGSIHNPHDDLNERLRTNTPTTRNTPSNTRNTNFPQSTNFPQNTNLKKPLPPMENLKQGAKEKEKEFEELTR